MRHVWSATIFGSLLFLAGNSLPAAEPEKPNLAIVMKVEWEQEVVDANGKVRVERREVSDTNVGDVLVYTLNFINRGDAPAVNAAIVDPIPLGTVYVLDSADGKGTIVSCSIDGGKSYQAPPAVYTVKNPDGTETQKVAPPEMYTHVKWRIPGQILPGAVGQLSFKVRVQ